MLTCIWSVSFVLNFVNEYMLIPIYMTMFVIRLLLDVGTDELLIISTNLTVGSKYAKKIKKENENAQNKMFPK